MSRKTSKTPSEIRQELESKLASAKAREARSLASDDPMIKQVQDVYDSYSRDIATISRQLKGPQSFDNRRTGCELRLEEINTGETLALALDSYYRSIRDYLRAELATLSDSVANGGNVTQKDVNKILKAAPEDTTASLFTAAKLAKDTRKAFTTGRNNENTPEAPQEAASEG